MTNRFLLNVEYFKWATRVPKMDYCRWSLSGEGGILSGTYLPAIAIEIHSGNLEAPRMKQCPDQEYCEFLLFFFYRKVPQMWTKMVSWKHYLVCSLDSYLNRFGIFADMLILCKVPPFTVCLVVLSCIYLHYYSDFCFF